MSHTLWYFLEKKNEDGKWEDLTIYTKEGDKYESYDIDTGNADWDLFNLIFEKFDGATRAVPNDLGPAASKLFDRTEDEEDSWFDYDPRTTYTTAWYDYVELSLLSKSKEAIVPNEWYEEGNGEPKFVNALESLMDQINFILNANRIWYVNPGDIRLICAMC